MNLLSVIAGPSGKASTMRVSSLATVAIVMGTWSYVSVGRMELQPISVEQLGLVVAALGAKAWQRGIEDPKKTSTP